MIFGDKQNNNRYVYFNKHVIPQILEWTVPLINKFDSLDRNYIKYKYKYNKGLKLNVIKDF